MTPMPIDALTTEADELYGLVPEEFTSARNARAKAVRADDRELAQRIGELRKPSPAAWIVNRLVREQPDGIDELLDLGQDLREAQSAGDGRALTGIGSERRKLVSGLLHEATRIADDAGRPPSRAVLDEVEQSLIAATVDERAGEALATGRLVRGIQAVGFEDVDLDGAVAGEASARRPPKRRTTRSGGEVTAERSGATASKRTSKQGAGDSDAAAEREAEAERRRVDAARAAERERAEADVQEARDRAEQAQRELDEAQDLLHAAEWHADELRDERHDLETRLKELRSEIADAERGEREAERARAKAATAADRARDDVEAAETALDALG
ncbi:hypothetical protein J2X63_003418 [Agromyces sp. 3263]|uniref:hypothetical protein n=1 Tax=Agromyces sp. 3263 TaxID=2817750 RepID=UPI00285A4769|nr:hypothetical protein [Agromyces sp. 3263]MDR6907710.1 hypothetical protein [Agromyces sp. 3263]